MHRFFGVSLSLVVKAWHGQTLGSGRSTSAAYKNRLSGWLGRTLHAYLSSFAL